jgi:hypothetical protein
VALLSQPHAQPEEVLLKLLEARLTEQGFRVFVDRPGPSGVEWAAEIRHQVGAADTVVPLLSETSIHSEMLAYEVELASQAAQTQKGRPRLLPIRVDYAGPLPFSSTLARILEPLPYVLWQSDQDDAGLVEQIVKALQRPSSPLPEPPGRSQWAGPCRWTRRSTSCGPPTRNLGPLWSAGTASCW